MGILARDLRKSVEGRERFDDCGLSDFGRAADIFFEAGYYLIETLRHMREHARALPIANLRRRHSKTSTIKSTRSALDLTETIQAKMKNANGYRVEEVQIPRAVGKWTPAFSDLAGILVPDLDVVNHFAIELTRLKQELPAYTPFVTGDLSATPWMPSDPAVTRAHDIWGKTQAAHRRANDQAMSSQLFTLNYIRLVLAGDLAGAWAAFVGLSAQLTHLGTLLSIASTENGLTAMAYCRSVRPTIETNSRIRTSDDMAPEMIKMLTEEHDAAKKAILRELAAAKIERRVGKSP